MPLLLSVMIVGTAVWFFPYAIFALSRRRNDIFNTVKSILVLLFASNLFYPLEPLPKWFRAAALANPITWQIDCLRWATIGVGNAQLVAMESIAFIVFAAASFLYAARCLQRQQ